MSSPHIFASNRHFMVAIEDVKEERHRQNAKWGQQDHDLGTWIQILGEEFGELSKATLPAALGGESSERQMIEATHVAAVAVQIMEYLNRRKAKEQA